MRQRTLARYVIAAVVLLRVFASVLPSRYAGPYEGISLTAAGYIAGSHPLGPAVSLTVLALYLWVRWLPVVPARNFPISIFAGVGRMLLGYLALGLCFISVPMALRDPEKRMWQDKVFGTRVVRWTD